MARERTPRAAAIVLVLAAGCGATPAPGPVVAPELRARIDAVEAPTLANVARMLDAVRVYRSTVRGHDDRGALAAAYPDMGYVDTVLSGPSLGTETLGTPIHVRTVEIWSADAEAILGFEDDHHLAGLFPLDTSGAVISRCDDCVVEGADGALAVHGVFGRVPEDVAGRHVELDGTLVPIALASATPDELGLFVDALNRSAYLIGFVRDDADLRLEGTQLVLPGIGGVTSEREGTVTHGCEEILGYHADRVIDLGDTSRRETRITSLDGRTERCCPRDATGAPCSPGPRCDVRPLP